MPSPLQRGSIVWVRTLDPQGRNEKVRPCVLLTPTAEIPTADSLVAVACTHSEPNPIPEYYVALPWQNVPGGHAKTGLRDRTWAVCHWPVAFKLDEIVRRGGFVPARYLGPIVANLPPGPAPDEAAPTDVPPPEPEPPAL